MSTANAIPATSRYHVLSPWYAEVTIPRFLPDGSVQYLAQKDKTICLVRQYPG